MFRNPTDRPGVAAALTILWAMLILGSERGYPFQQTFHHDIGSPVLALELSRGSGDIEAVLHRKDPGAATTAEARKASQTNVDKAREIQWRANLLDLVFIPIYTFFLWAVARLFSHRIFLLTMAIVAVGIFDYWEDWRIFQALSGENPAIYVPSLFKWGLMALVLMAIGSILMGAGAAIYSLATNRLLALAYWLSGALMGIAVATGQWFGYSLIPLSMEIFSVVTLIHAIGLLGHYITIRGVTPVYTENFCEKRGKAGGESLVAVTPTRSQ
jgi:hypothetical protein